MLFRFVPFPPRPGPKEVEHFFDGVLEECVRVLEELLKGAKDVLMSDLGHLIVP
jgi:hypothetical protein